MDLPSWKRLGRPDRAVLPLRAFLGVVFSYAGLQKLADRNFFKASSPTSIQSQLRAYSQRSPIGGFLHVATHFPVPLGVLIAFGELAVGLGVVLGLWARVAAGGGMAISVGFLLTSSWHTNPFYLGPDLVYLVAFTPLLAMGSGPWSLDEVIRRRAADEVGAELPAPKETVAFERLQRVCRAYEQGRCQLQKGAPCAPVGCPVLRSPPLSAPVDLERRTLALQAAAAMAIGVGAVVVGGATGILGRLLDRGHSPANPSLAAGRALAPGQTSAPGTTAGPAQPVAGGPTSVPRAGRSNPAPSATTAVPPTGTPIGAAANVPVGGAASFTNPATGSVGWVVRPSSAHYAAFSGSCTHAGCPVRPAGARFVCPCHGAVFDKATGAVLQGPARRPLANIPVTVGPDGQLYVT